MAFCSLYGSRKRTAMPPGYLQLLLLVWGTLCMQTTSGRYFGDFLGGGLDSKAPKDDKVFFTHDPPMPAMTVAQLGDTVILECEAGGSPAPKVYWRKHGTPLEQGNEIPNAGTYSEVELANTIGRLRITNVDYGNLGVYECVAEHHSDIIIARTQLTLPDEPIVNRISYLRRRRNMAASGGLTTPFINMWIRRSVTMNDEDLTLYCRAEGHPMPSIQWYDRDGLPVKNRSDKFKVSSEGDLTVYNVAWSDMGHYTCEASSPMGTTNVTSFFYPLAHK